MQLRGHSGTYINKQVLGEVEASGTSGDKKQTSRQAPAEDCLCSVGVSLREAVWGRVQAEIA